MRKLYHPFWVGFAIVLSFLAIIAGFPAFQRQFGFPMSFVLTGAIVLAVWLNYLVRALIFSNMGEKKEET